MFVGARGVRFEHRARKFGFQNAAVGDRLASARSRQLGLLFKAALKWDGTSDILTLGLALAVVILAATAYSYVLARFSSEHGDP